MAKISALPNTLTDPQAADLIAVVDDGDDETKKMTLGTLFNAIWPVGSIYVNSEDDTNPGTLMGFGTWERFGNGRVLVGVNESDTDFDTPEMTGGQKTVQAHQHNNTWRVAYPRSTSVLSTNDLGGDAVLVSDNVPGGDTSAAYNPPSNPKLTASAGTGDTNMNPYVAVYMWKRTA